MFIAKFHISNLLTYLGAVSAVFGICAAAGGFSAKGIICLVLCGVCDLFDGAFARRFSRTDSQRAFGIQIDSLADVLSFAALPVALMYSAGMQSPLQMLVLAIYAAAAIHRLAHFSAQESRREGDDPVKFYRGLPVTYAAFFFSLCWLIKYTNISEYFEVAATALTAALALFFVLDVPVKKPRGVFYVLFAAVAVAVVATILVLE